LLLSGFVSQGADLDIQKILKGVEDHYNRVKTLQVGFAETYSLKSRRFSEKGDLFLRKPGRMRWQYSSPAGKLFLADGKFVYSYNPEEKRAEKLPLKETEDLKAPLAFLLGHLQFNDDFREFRSRPEDGGVFITAIPKSDKMPYSEVSFLTGADFVIRKLIVKGQDASLMEFIFTNEKMNPPLPETLFKFTPPPGVEFSDLTKQ
jgi:outer membrane lipoprotein carrier protein